MENIHKMNLVFMAAEVIGLYIILLVAYSILTYVYCSVKYSKAQKGIQEYYKRSDADEESLRPRGKKKRKNYREENKRMTVLLELKQKIKEFYSEHDVLLLSVFKFFLAFLFVLTALIPVWDLWKNWIIFLLC